MAKHGQRVELTFLDMSMMGYPMHLQGHTFQVGGMTIAPLTL
ncbi:multicopper oxidase domain-containing protein [Ensifer sp. LBL]